jgi:hypothetical protein
MSSASPHALLLANRAEVDAAVASVQPVVRAPLTPADSFRAVGVSGAVDSTQRDGCTWRLVGMDGREFYPFYGWLFAAKASTVGGLTTRCELVHRAVGRSRGRHDVEPSTGNDSIFAARIGC